MGMVNDRRWCIEWRGMGLRERAYSVKDSGEQGMWVSGKWYGLKGRDGRKSNLA